MHPQRHKLLSAHRIMWQALCQHQHRPAQRRHLHTPKQHLTAPTEATPGAGGAAAEAEAHTDATSHSRTTAGITQVLTCQKERDQIAI